jgi:uracil-DNA glycosylase family 4
MTNLHTFLAEHKAAMDRGAKCTECPLFKKHVEDGQGRGPVMGEVTRNSKLVVIGEAPGNREVETGRPFMGASGRILNGQLIKGGLDREQKGDVSVTNTILCQPPDDFEAYEDKLRAKAKTAGKEVVLPTLCCAPRLERDIREANAPVEYAVGRQALAALARHHGVPYGKEKKKRERGDISIANLRKQHGAPIPVRPIGHPEGAKTLIASYHPAYAMRGAKAWMPVIKTVIKRAALIAGRGGAIDWQKPKYNLAPTIDEIEEFAREAFDTDRVVMVDIETGPSRPGADDGGSIQTCALRTVGWGFRRETGEEVIMVVPYRDMAGDPLWSGEQCERVDAAIRLVMDKCKLAGQNFSFDSAVLLRLGLMTDRKKRWADIMLAHHDTDSNDLPHDLGFIISEHFEAPHHKADVDHKSVNNVDYGMLCEYNGDDVLTQLRCLEAVLTRISQLGTVEQYKTDTKIAPVVRDMGDLGLVIDEHERQRLAGVLTERIDYFRSKFRFEVAMMFVSPQEAARVEARLKQMAADWRNRPDSEVAAAWTRAYQNYALDKGYGEFNPNSVYQLRDLLFDKLNLTPILNTDGYEFDDEADDDPSTGQAAILKLLEKYDHIQGFCDALLEYRAYSKLYGTYVADKKGRIKDVDWTKWGLPPNAAKRILHTVYKVHVIPSGRLSTQPAIQNWPAVGKASMRTMVVAPDGHCIVGADYDQLELRIYAVVAQDQLLLQAFSEKDKHGAPIDPHSLNAAALLADTEGEIWDQYYKIKYDMTDKERKYWRTVAKRFCYLETYGGEEDKLFSTMAASRNKATGKRDFPNLQLKDVETWHKRWHKLHPETKKWQDNCKYIAYNRGHVRVGTLDYRARFWPGGIDKKNAPPNHTIQGFAASIANKALIDLNEAIPYRAWSPVSGINLQIHDYIGGYVPRDRAWEAKGIIEECLSYEFKGMKFTCTAESSYRWSDQG